MAQPRGARTSTWLLLAAVSVLGAAPERPPENPAKIVVEVAPQVVASGESVDLTVKLTPHAGIKINRYPQIKLQVPEQPGLVAAGEARIGDAQPPEKEGANYWSAVDPVRLTLSLDRSFSPGRHELEGKLTYYFCIPDSYCAPARVPLKIPVEVR
jgi:hypothetical protein